MATPAIRAVREQFPDAHLVGIGKPYVAGVFEGSPHLNEWINFDKRGPGQQGLFPVARLLRHSEIDVGVIFPNSLRAALLARLGGCKRRIGFARYGRSMLLTDRLHASRNRLGRIVPAPVLLDYNRLVEQTGATVTSLRLELFTNREDEKLAEDVWVRMGCCEQSEVVTLNPGAAFGSAKLWPAQYFADLARRLTDEHGCKVLVLCGPAERELARQIVRLSHRCQVFSLAEEAVSLGLTKACVRRCNLLISTDSGPRHFAAAFSKPVVALFGPTFINWTNTFFPLEIRLQRQVPCGPCQQRQCHLDHRCMKDLTPDEVYRAALSLLNRSGLRFQPEVSRAN